MARTDIHRPGSADFDPENYTCFGVFDLHPEEGDSAARRRMVSALVDAGYSFKGAPHGSSQCSHCGTRIRYAALMGHEPTKTLLYVGETCLDNRFEMTQAEFQALRAQAALNRERMAKADRIAAILEEYPNLVWASYAHNISVVGGVEEWTTAYSYGDVEFDTQEQAEAWIAEQPNHHNDYAIRGYKRGTTWSERTRQGQSTTTLQDIWWKVEKYGQISEKQADYAERLVGWLTEAEERLAAREAETAAKVAAGVEVPTGRIVIEGTVVSTKFVSNDFGGTTKMLVEHESGWKVWGSVPSSIWDVEKGARVRFTATVERSNDDALFGFFKRPAKAEVL